MCTHTHVIPFLSLCHTDHNSGADEEGVGEEAAAVAVAAAMRPKTTHSRRLLPAVFAMLRRLGEKRKRSVAPLLFVMRMSIAN